MGNFVSGVIVSGKYDKKVDFWDNTRKNGQILNAKLKKHKK